MKKISFHIVLTFIIVFILSGCELFMEFSQEKKIIRIEVDSTSIDAQVDIDEFTLDSIRIIYIYNDESVEYVYLMETMISSMDLDKLQTPGTHEITLSYLEHTATFFITLTDVMNAVYLVRFVDFDGTILKEELVHNGEGAIAPSSPTRDGYAFINWDENFSSVNQNLEVNAVYRSNEKFELDGYTIKIAVSANDVGKVDPFHEAYQDFDKLAKQQAWNLVEETHNCKIEVVPYPSDAEWGEPRLHYIINKANDNTADYDFYSIHGSQLTRLVISAKLINVTNWYAQYGEDFMNEIYIQSGSYRERLYSITDEEPGISNVMYYNIGLLSRLGLEKTPAQIFNEGNWTYTAFREYCIAAQTALDNLKEASATNKFYAVAGCSPYYWIGMTSAGGTKITDVSTLTFQPLTETALSAASTLRAINEAGAMDPAKQVDSGVLSWNDGRALFSSGSLWFVNNSNHWKEDLWSPGNPDHTKYGYVPFPRPDGTTKEDQRLGIGGTDTWVMPVGRDYSGYGPQCTTENIYRVIVKAFQLTKEYYLDSPNYNYNQSLEAYALRYTDSEDSVIAFKYITERVSEIGFFEPLTEPVNQVVNTGYSSFSTAVDDYIMGNSPTLSEALFSLQYVITVALRNAFPKK